jgi:uncharacterized protein
MPKKRQPRKSSVTGVDASLARHGGLSYLEIPAIDPGRSAVFYAKVFGWKLHGNAGRPKFIDRTGHLLGRWVRRRAISSKPGFLPYIYVDRIEAAVKRVVAGGGEIIKAPFAEGNLRVSVIRDPAGNHIGIWQAAGPNAGKPLAVHADDK